MANLVNPEFVNIGNEMDIKMEDSEMASNISVETNIEINIDLKNEDNCEFGDSEMVNEPEEPFQILTFEDESEASHSISCPMCHCPFDPLTQIEDHLYFEHCQSSRSFNNGQPSVIYSCQLYPCLFMSHRKSTLVLHYFEHIEGPGNKTQNNAILPDSNLPDPLGLPIFLNQNAMNNPIRLIAPKRRINPNSTLKAIKKSKERKKYFPCIEHGCAEEFNKLWDLRIHKVKDHQLKGHNVVDPVPFWTCDYCNLISLGRKGIISHTKYKHEGKELKISSYSQSRIPGSGRPRKTLDTFDITKLNKGPQINKSKTRNLFWEKYFRMIEDPNYRDFYQCIEEGCDLRFHLLKNIQKHIKNDHGVEWQTLHKRRYHSLIYNCKNFGLYQCKLCEWTGSLNPMVHIKSVHNDEYSKSLAEGNLVKDHPAGRPQKIKLQKASTIKKGTKSTQVPRGPMGRPRKNSNLVAHGSHSLQ